MDERELLREVKDYAQELSRTADEHHPRDRTAEDIGWMSPGPMVPNRLRRSALVTVVLVTVLATGAIAALVTVDRSSTPHEQPRVSHAVPSDIGGRNRGTASRRRLVARCRRRPFRRTGNHVCRLDRPRTRRVGRRRRDGTAINSAPTARRTTRRPTLGGSCPLRRCRRAFNRPRSGREPNLSSGAATTTRARRTFTPRPTVRRTFRPRIRGGCSPRLRSQLESSQSRFGPDPKSYCSVADRRSALPAARATPTARRTTP